MSISTAAMPPHTRKPAAVPTDPIWRLRIDQYHAMIEGGILTDDDPVELLEGWLVPKMPKKPRHRAATRLLYKSLDRIMPAGWYVDTQEPITIVDSEPEPDVMVVRGDTRQYLDRHPGSQDLALVVEVADTTLARDRGSKLQIYARAGIPIYWIVNLIDNQIEVYTDPTGPAGEPTYHKRRVYGSDKSLPILIAGKKVGRLTVRDLLP